ncbi:hypothetical protein AVEN_119003-1 [Araneus ventricosus]|uniref:Uncharacterized protein n=1 Tax=Araneus ventricosus TaxID=182803 RepID=A0A4Y2KR41_ARAVE|nr:hypothetical protein AVEN_119003-1 [Araneus ventricosus]
METSLFGSFLYGPVKVTLENMPYNENIAELVGIKPVCSGSSMFAVWRKLREIDCEIDFQKEAENNLVVGSNQHSSTKLINSKSDVKDINSPILSMFSLEREFSSASVLQVHLSFLQAVSLVKS